MFVSRHRNAGQIHKRRLTDPLKIRQVKKIGIDTNKQKLHL
jgi:hypothetical protein